MSSQKSLSDIRILISNDDGVHAEGIKVLEKIALSITPDVWVVAPEKQQSGKGCSSTFDTILRVQQWGPRRFSVTGTPADNVHVAIDQILTDKKPDLVLSGINEDSNIGNYVMLSGTLGAAFAGIAEGVKSIAVSQHIKRGLPTKYNLPETYLADIIRKLFNIDWSSDTVMNVNFPLCSQNDVGGIRITRQANVDVKWKSIPSEDPHGYPCYWMTSHLEPKPEDICGTDLEAIYNDNFISITPLRNDLTDYNCVNVLKEEFYGA